MMGAYIRPRDGDYEYPAEIMIYEARTGSILETIKIKRIGVVHFISDLAKALANSEPPHGGDR